MTIKSTSNRVVAFRVAAIVAAGLAGAPPASAAETCFQGLAATRSYSLGRPQSAVPTQDGHAILYLRSGPRDTHLGLYAYDLAAKTERALATPASAPEHLSVEEKARRERARMTLTGITDFQPQPTTAARILVAQADHLSTIALALGRDTPVPDAGWIAPRLSPDGSFVAAVRDNDLHVVDLATGQDRAAHHRRHRHAHPRPGRVRRRRGARSRRRPLVVARRQPAGL